MWQFHLYTDLSCDLYIHIKAYIKRIESKLYYLRIFHMDIFPHIILQTQYA